MLRRHVKALTGIRRQVIQQRRFVHYFLWRLTIGSESLQVQLVLALPKRVKITLAIVGKRLSRARLIGKQHRRQIQSIHVLVRFSAS